MWSQSLIPQLISAKNSALVCKSTYWHPHSILAELLLDKTMGVSASSPVQYRSACSNVLCVLAALLLAKTLDTSVKG